MVTITRVEDPDDTQRELFDAWAEVIAADGRHTFGPDHTAHSADELREVGRRPDLPRTTWAALDEAGTVVGAAGVGLPQHDNLAQAMLLVVVHPEHRRRGIGTALLEQAEATARDAGRTVFLAETQWRVDGRDEHGEGFAARHGYAAAQTVLRSTLSLPADRARLDAALAGEVVGEVDGGRPGAGIVGNGTDGYLLRSCWDGIPQGWLAGRAELSRRMSTDIPMGGLQLEEEHWDEERVRAEYARIERMGRRVVDTFAVLESTGELVGYTQVQVPRDQPEVAFQQDTLVMREHRGHALGLRMKAASTVALMQESPATVSVRTWNADDNAAMLRVNRAIGYVHDAMMCEWQKVVPS